MSPYIKIFLSGIYKTNQRDFWVLILANIGSAIILNIYPFHFLIQGAVIVLLAFKNFTFIRSASVMPSIASDFDKYSWKYFQGLPLNKQELLISLVISNLFVMFPLMVWVLSFFRQISFVFTENQIQTFSILPIKTFLCLIPIMLIISISSIKNLFVFPRQQYSKNDPKLVFFDKVKNITIYATGLMYGWMLYETLQHWIGFSIQPYLQTIYDFVTGLSTWWFLPALIALTFHNFFNAIHIWQNEEKSYIKINWNHKRDFSILGICLILFSAPLYLLDLNVPARYNDGAIIRAVYRSNYTGLEKLLARGKDVNSVNRYGFTPVLAAATLGNLDMFKYLEKKGARLEGVITIDKRYIGNTLLLSAIEGGNEELVKYLLEKGFDPNVKNEKLKHYPLHSAAAKCKTNILDMLIEKNAKIEALDNLNRTALHNASLSGCFGSVASLIEAGINPQVKDVKDQTALDYASKKDWHKDLRYYLEKKNRAPASK